MRVACIIPTYNGSRELIRLFESIALQNSRFSIFVIDSSSSDNTQEIASFIASVSTIPSAEFNHGGTRQLMVDKNPEFDIYIFLTQDAILANPDAIAKIVEPFKDPLVGAVCGRQLPHIDASLLAQHARFYNYPAQSRKVSLSDVPAMGIKAAFMSNSFAAYRRSALLEVGGFPNHVIFAEDMFVAAKMLLSGWHVAYESAALCNHSHNYTIKQEFQRYFDMGVFHARERWIKEKFGGAGGEGIRYVKSELRFLGLKCIHMWPGALLRNAAKLLAYKIGQYESFLPIFIKRELGMYKRYWDGPFAKHKH